MIKLSFRVCPLCSVHIALHTKSELLKVYEFTSNEKKMNNNKCLYMDVLESISGHSNPEGLWIIYLN